VVDAPQSSFFVPPEEQRRATMRAVILNQANLAVRVAEANQLLPQEQDAQRVAVGCRDF